MDGIGGNTDRCSHAVGLPFAPSGAFIYMDANGKPTAWLQRSVFPPIPSIFDVNTVYGEPAHLQQGWTDIPYDRFQRWAIPELWSFDGRLSLGNRSAAPSHGNGGGKIGMGEAEPR